jgi:hypothetical protein
MASSRLPAGCDRDAQSKGRTSLPKISIAHDGGAHSSREYSLASGRPGHSCGHRQAPEELHRNGLACSDPGQARFQAPAGANLAMTGLIRTRAGCRAAMVYRGGIMGDFAGKESDGLRRAAGRSFSRPFLVGPPFSPPARHDLMGAQHPFPAHFMQRFMTRWTSMSTPITASPCVRSSSSGLRHS